MNDYIKEARRIVTGYFAALAPSEQLRRETAQELRQGHITEGYARELTLSANSEASNCARTHRASLTHWQDALPALPQQRTPRTATRSRAATIGCWPKISP